MGLLPRDRDSDRVDIVEGSEEADFERLGTDRISSSSRSSSARFLALSASSFASSSSATPFLLHCQESDLGSLGDSAHFCSRGFGFSLSSFGMSFGLRSCWVRDGRETYGRS